MLGAVLMFGLLVITLVVVQVQFVPVWREQREVQQMAEMADQLGAIKADLDRQVGNTTASGLVAPLTLQSEEGFTFFGGPSAASGATVSFTPAPAGTGILLQSPQLRIQQTGGQGLYGLTEQWNSSSGPVNDILSVEHLRLRIDMDPGSYDDGDSATLNIQDADGDFAGKAVVSFRDFASEEALEIKTYDAANNELSSDVEAFFHQVSVDYFYWDLLDRSLLFRDVLAAAEAPFSFTVARAGLDMDYTVAYASSAIGGGIVGGGIVEPDYADTLASGSLTVEARNDGFVDQTYILEHGALILEQDNATFMTIPPQIAVRTAGGFVALEWTMPGLAGSATAVGGIRAATISLQPAGDRQDMTAVGARMNLTLPTEHPTLWRDHIRDTLVAAGLTDSGATPVFTVATTATSVTLHLFGPTSAPASTTEDIALRIRQASIEVQVRPAG